MKIRIFCLIAAIVAVCFIPVVAVAEEEVTFEDVLNSLIDGLDSNDANLELDKIWEKFGFEQASFKDKILSIINGDFAVDYGSVTSAVFSLVFSGIKSLVPVMLCICAIALFYALVSVFNPNFLSEGIMRVLYFTCYAAMIGLVIYKTFDTVYACFDGIESYAKQMEVVFPLILTVMTALGANVSAAVYQPAVAFLSTGVTGVITSFVLPMTVFLIIFSAISGLSQTLKTEKLASFVSSVIKWILGICVTVFTMFLSIQGLTAGMYDGITLRVTKYAIGNTVPIVGGFLKDGVDLFLAAGLLIKNALGVCGIILVVGGMIKPVVELIAFSLFLKLTAGLIEPFVDAKMSGFMYDLSKNLGFVLAATLIVCFMYVITIVLLICTGGSLL